MVDALLAQAYEAYEKRLRDASAVDFDDLLVHMVAILKEHKDVRAELDRRYRYVLVEGPPLLGPLRPERLIAMGESQSAAFLVTYVNAVDPAARVYEYYDPSKQGVGKPAQLTVKGRP